MKTLLDISPTVQAALPSGRVVALETTVVAHGLPYPQNLSTAQEMEAIVSREGATPASIAIMGGRIRVGLAPSALDELATSREVLKLSRRDIAACLERRCTGATTVAATMILAHLAGIRVFATGGVGGVHRVPAGCPPADCPPPMSREPELARTPVCVVQRRQVHSDLPATLEWLETWGARYRLPDRPVPAFSSAPAACWSLSAPTHQKRSLPSAEPTGIWAWAGCW